jgi:hypothetical protein
MPIEVEDQQWRYSNLGKALSLVEAGSITLRQIERPDSNGERIGLLQSKGEENVLYRQPGRVKVTSRIANVGVDMVVEKLRGIRQWLTASR